MKLSELHSQAVDYPKVGRRLACILRSVRPHADWTHWLRRVCPLTLPQSLDLATRRNLTGTLANGAIPVMARSTQARKRSGSSSATSPCQTCRCLRQVGLCLHSIASSKPTKKNALLHRPSSGQRDPPPSSDSTPATTLLCPACSDPCHIRPEWTEI